MTNVELVDKIIKNNDKKAYDLLFHRLYAPMIRLAFYYVRSTETAQDVVSDVWLHFLKKKDSISEIHSVESFFCVAVRNRALKMLKKRNLRDIMFHHASLKDFDVVTCEHPGQLLLNKELFDLFKTTIENLPEKRKIVFQLIKEDGLKYKEVAELLDLSVKTVDKHLTLAVKALRVAIDRYRHSLDVRILK